MRHKYLQLVNFNMFELLACRNLLGRTAYAAAESIDKRLVYTVVSVATITNHAHNINEYKCVALIHNLV